MRNPLSRRMFLRAAAAFGTVIVGFDRRARSWIVQGQTRPEGLDDLPELEGTLAIDDASRQAFSTDHGNYILRRPLAVLRPGSVEDVVRMVRYANRHSLQIAMRGQAIPGPARRWLKPGSSSTHVHSQPSKWGTARA